MKAHALLAIIAVWSSSDYASPILSLLEARQQCRCVPASEPGSFENWVGRDLAPSFLSVSAALVTFDGDAGALVTFDGDGISDPDGSLNVARAGMFAVVALSMKEETVKGRF